MTVEEARTFLADMILELEDSHNEFQRKTYADNFQKRFKDAEPNLMLLDKAHEEAEDKEAFINAIASAPAEAAKKVIDQLPGNRKKGLQEMNYSLSMVTFVLPMLLYYEAPFMEDLAEKIAQDWGDVFPKSKIKKARFEDINAGFRRRFCYITTAVCESLSKPDDCYELNLLRGYRDGYLSEREDGPELIRLYYDIAPTIVKRIDREEDPSAAYRAIYDDYLLPCIRMIEENDLSACEHTYRNMVTELRDRYLFQ